MAFGQTEILIIVLIIVILFGAATIPKLARSLGRAQGEFKKAKGEFEKEMKAAETSSNQAPAAPAAPVAPAPPAAAPVQPAAADDDEESVKRDPASKQEGADE